MTVHQQLSVCLNLIERMHQFIRAGRWHKLSELESEYRHTFTQLKAEVAAGTVDADAVQSMMRLEQQQRRLQRLLSLGLMEAGEKLSIIEDTHKKLQISSQVVSTLAG